jgi:hypothetical protein
MNRITVDLTPELEQALRDKAGLNGQTLERYLVGLAEHDAGNGSNAIRASPSQEEELDERPWRGLLILPRLKRPIFEKATGGRVMQKRSPAPNMKYHRPALDDE